MHFAVLASADSWYARDLARAAASDFEITTLPFSEISSRINDGLHVISAGRDLAEFDGVIVRTMPPGSLEQVVFRMDCLGRYEAAGGVGVHADRPVPLRRRRPSLPTRWTIDEEVIGRVGDDGVDDNALRAEARHHLEGTRFARSSRLLAWTPTSVPPRLASCARFCSC